MRRFLALLPLARGWMTMFSSGDASSVGDLVLAGKDPNVKLLTGENFEEFVSKPNTASAVMFTAPWCFPCHVVLPMWAEAAAQLAKGDVADPNAVGNDSVAIQFGVVDATKNATLTAEHHVNGFPAMKLFVDSEVFPYTQQSGGQTAFSATVIVNWVHRHTNRRHTVESETQLGEFFKANPLSAVALFDPAKTPPSTMYNYIHSSLHFEDVSFLELSPALAPALAALTGRPLISEFPALVMIYDHDDQYAQMEGEWSSARIDAFIRGRRLLTVNAFQPGTIDYVLDAGLPLLFLVGGSSDPSVQAAFRGVAQKFLGSLVAVAVGTSMPWEDKLGEILDVKGLEKAVVRILVQPDSVHHDHESGSQSQAVIKHGSKFRPVSDEDTLTVESITRFVNSYLGNELGSYLRSEPEPENPKDSYTPGSILVNAVGSNFEKLVTNDLGRDILVVYHAPWCGHCRKLMPVLRDLGTALSHTGRGLKIVKIDATLNEVPGVSIPGYPTIILYKAVKERIPIHIRPQVPFNGERSVEDFKAFLHANAANEFSDSKPIAAGNDDFAYIQEL